MGAILWSEAVQDSHEALRKMDRDGKEALEDIRTGRPAPVPVRIVR